MPSSLCMLTSFLDRWPRWNNGWWKVNLLIYSFNFGIILHIKG
jgi:hypothetical protein